MKKFLFSTFSVLCMVIALASCSSKASNELIGKWEQDLLQQGMNAHVTYDFEEGGKLSQTFEMTGDVPKVDIKGEGTCTYTYADNVITFTFSGADFNFSKSEMEGVPQELVDMSMQQVKSSMVDVEQKITDVKINGNTLTGTLNGMQITLKRI